MAKRMPAVNVGDTFDRWTVTEVGLRRPQTPSQARRGRSGDPSAWCCCICGVERLVRLADLRNGSSRSCGCLREETTRSRNLASWSDPEYAATQRARLRAHNEALNNDHDFITRRDAWLARWNRERSGHRLSKHPLYVKHRGILHRCYNPQFFAYPNYGARGISMHGPFHDVRMFIEWVEGNLGPCPEGMSLDRIDNDGHYAPGNLRWASALVQTLNRGHGIVVPLMGPPCQISLACLCSQREVHGASGGPRMGEPLCE